MDGIRIEESNRNLSALLHAFARHFHATSTVVDCEVMAVPVGTRARRGFQWQQATAPLEDGASQAFALCERWSRTRTALTAAKLRKLSEVLALQEVSRAAVRRQRISALLVAHMVGNWCFNCGCEYSDCTHDDGCGTKSNAEECDLAKQGLWQRKQQLIAALRAKFTWDDEGSDPPTTEISSYLRFALTAAGHACQLELRISPLKHVLTRCIAAGATAAGSSGVGEGLWLEFGVGEGHSVSLIARTIANLRMKDHAGDGFYGEGRDASVVVADAVADADADADADSNTDAIDGANTSVGATLALPTDGVVYGFDSFAGLPDDWRPGFSAGHFAQCEGRPTCRAFAALTAREASTVCLVRGLFQETLPNFLLQHTSPAALVHIDCDIYASALFVLEELLRHGRLRRGTIIVFDEIFGYCGYENHECRALFEVAQRHKMRYRWLGMQQRGAMQAALVVEEVSSCDSNIYPGSKEAY